MDTQSQSPYAEFTGRATVYVRPGLVIALSVGDAMLEALLTPHEALHIASLLVEQAAQRIAVAVDATAAIDNARVTSAEICN